jgi:hypothetical protein
MSRILAAILFVVACGAGSASAQDYTLSMSTGLSGAPGDTVLVQCLLDIAPGAAPLNGWSQGICHDPSLVHPLEANSGSTTQTSNNGAPPGFEQVGITETAPGIGVTQGVVISLLGTATLPPGTGYETLTVLYELMGADGDFATLSYCDDAGAPPVETVVVPAGISVTPAQVGTTITIEVIPLVLFFGTADPIAQGQSTDLSVLLTNSSAVYGFQLGVAHDGATLQATAVEAGAALGALNGGAGPDFFVESLDPEGGDGITLGCLFSTVGLSEQLLPGVDQEIARITYQAQPTAPLGDTTVQFTDSLSPGAPAPAVETLISTGEEVETPIQSPGTLTIEVGGAVFIRGDVTGDAVVDIGDPVTLLGFLFGGDSAPPCLDAGDFDNGGGLDIGDAVNILTYLFGGGPSPAAPFPECGIDPEGDSDSVTCETSASGC